MRAYAPPVEECDSTGSFERPDRSGEDVRSMSLNAPAPYQHHKNETWRIPLRVE